MAMAEMTKVVVNFTPTAEHISRPSRQLLQWLHAYKMGQNQRLEVVAQLSKGTRPTDNYVEATYTSKETLRITAASSSAQGLWGKLLYKAELVQNQKLLRAAGFKGDQIQRDRPEKIEPRPVIWPSKETFTYYGHQAVGS